MTDTYNESTWIITPTETPVIIRNCSKCGQKKEFYCSEKFRLNGNHTRIDVWLIYKCIKCDTTWKLTITKGVKPNDFPAGIFDKLINNDKDLVWQYAFDRSLLKRNDCEIQYKNIEYTVDEIDKHSIQEPLRVHIKSLYPFNLKLSALLAKMLDVSISQIKKFVQDGFITTEPACDLMKYRITDEINVILRMNILNNINIIQDDKL